MECCHGGEINKQANKNGGNDFWHKHTRQRLEKKPFVLYLLSSPCIKIPHKGFAMYCIEQLIYHLVIKNVVFTLMKNFLKVLAAPDWKIWLCLLAEPSGFLSSENK